MHPWITATVALDIAAARDREIAEARRAAELREGRRREVAGPAVDRRGRGSTDLPAFALLLRAIPAWGVRRIASLGVPPRDAGTRLRRADPSAAAVDRP